MKKIFKKVALVATVVFAGMSLNSCFTQGLGLAGNGLAGNALGTGLGNGYVNTGYGSGSNTQQALLNLATFLTQVNGGSETSFAGSAKFQRDYMKDGGWLFNPGTGEAKNDNYAVKLTVEGTTPIARIIGAVAKKQAQGSAASITMGNITVEGVTLSNVKLTAVSYDTKTGDIGDVKDAGYAYSVQYTMNGKTYTTPADFSSTPYAFVKGSLSAANNVASINLSVQIAIDDNTQIEVNYTGASK